MRILFDIGGTHMRVAAAESDKRIGEVTILDTPQDFTAGVHMLAEAARGLTGDAEITAAAGGFPGSFGREGGVPYGAPNLPSWIGKPVRDELQEAFGAPVTILNDADIAALGEAHYGNGRGYDIVAYLTISTGIGGGRVVDGVLDAYRFGFEPGHQVIDAAGTLGDGDGRPQKLEDCIGGAALEKRFGISARNIDDPAVWQQSHRLLAVGIVNVIRFWSPDVIVLGGGQVLGGSIEVEEVERIVRGDIRELLPSSSEAIPAFSEAELGDEAGLCGALALLSRDEQV